MGGSPTRARTWDLRINSPSLYQLSYRGSGKRARFYRSPALLDDLRDSLGDVVDVLRVERGDADAAGLDGVDRVVLAQAQDLILRQAGVREHAALGDDVPEFRLRRPLLDLRDEVQAQALDAIAHGAELLVPQRAQFGRGEHCRGELAAVRRRIGVVGAHDPLQLGK